jgi:hypothetical protein
MGLEYPRLPSNVSSGVSFLPTHLAFHTPNNDVYRRREDECVDPYLHKIDSGSPSSNRKAIIVTLPNSPSLEEHGIPTSQTRLRDRRVSVQTVPVHMMTTHPSRPSLDKRAVWDDESTSNSSSSDGRSGMDNDWRQFRVEWIDFEGDP